MENKISIDMKTFLKSLLTLVAVSLPVMLSAQKNADPQGTITYCLPSTTVALEVTALQENMLDAANEVKTVNDDVIADVVEYVEYVVNSYSASY